MEHKTTFTYFNDYATFEVGSLVIKVDLQDTKAIREKSWFVVDEKRKYIATYEKKTDRFPARNVYLHRYITGVSCTHQVRFANGEPTDCRRENLVLTPIKYGKTLQQPLDAVGCGIYSITNLKSEKVYVGSASKLELRWEMHVHDMRNGKGNKNLRADWHEQPAKDFFFSILQFCPKEELLKREEGWIRGYEKLGVELYNVQLRPYSNPYPPITQGATVSGGLN